VGNDARLPTQNTKFRVANSKVGGQSKKKSALSIPFLPILFRKRVGDPDA